MLLFFTGIHAEQADPQVQEWSLQGPNQSAAQAAVVGTAANSVIKGSDHLFPPCAVLVNLRYHKYKIVRFKSANY